MRFATRFRLGLEKEMGFVNLGVRFFRFAYRGPYKELANLSLYVCLFVKCSYFTKLKNDGNILKVHESLSMVLQG